MVAWLMWFSRNSLVYEQTLWMDNKIIDKAKLVLANHKISTTISNRNFTPACSKWVPPPLGQFKVNFDTALGNSSDGFGITAVIRDD